VGETSPLIYTALFSSLKQYNSILDRVLGKPSQHIDATVTTVTAEERAALENALRGGDD
jgi:hypothetical protein